MNELQALTLACLLFEFELEAPQVHPPPPEWERELTAAKACLARLKSQLEKPAEAANSVCAEQDRPFW